MPETSTLAVPAVRHLAPVGRCVTGASNGTGTEPTPKWRVVCFPHAGGSASWYRRLAVVPAPLGAGQRVPRGALHGVLGDTAPEVVGVQYPGRETRWSDEPARTMSALVDDVAPAVRQLVADGLPTVLLGHSLGAAVAVEVTRRLVAQGAAPACLALSGRAAPGARAFAPVPRDDAGLRGWIEDLGGTPAGLLDDPGTFAVVTRPLLADLDVHASWDGSDAEIAVPLVLLAGEDDPAAHPIEVGAWGGRARAGARFAAFPGGHFFLADHAAQVVGTLRAALEAAA